VGAQRNSGRTRRVLPFLLVPLIGLAIVVAVWPSRAHAPADSGAHAVAAAETGAPGALAEQAAHADTAHPELATADPANPYLVLRDATMPILQTGGAGKALAELERRIRANPDYSGVCHAVAHELGHAEYARLAGNVAAAMDGRNDVCGSGYLHGLVEIALGKSKNIGKSMMRICAPAQEGTCLHGVGHGVMFATSMDVKKSERLCSQFGDIKQQARCAEGVYMQLWTPDGGARHAAGPNAPEVSTASALRECNRAKDPYKTACWFYTPTIVLNGQPYDWQAAVDWCAKTIKDPEGRSTCSTGLGSRAVKYQPSDITAAYAICQRLPGNLEANCLRGMGAYWSVHWKGRKAPITVCDRIKPAKAAARCRAAIAATMVNTSID
jgi:hypothetical protein